MIFVELDNQSRFVQYHSNKDNISPEHCDCVIKIDDELYNVLQLKMPWWLSSFNTLKTYTVSDIDLFVEIVPTQTMSDKERIEELEQMVNILLLGGL